MVVNHRNDIQLVVAGAVRALQRRPPADADTALTELTQGALGSVRSAQHAGITVVSQDGSVRTASTTSHYPSMLDKIQGNHRAGPCLTAAWKNLVVRIDDLSGEQRWPGYCRDAAEQTPIRSMMCFPLFAGQHSAGALNFFAEQSHAFDDDAVETGLLVATNTAVGWHMLCRDQQFRSALASRDIIGQAKGVLMERFDVDAAQAFELLKRLSQASNTKLIEVARQLIERQHRHADRP